MDAGVREFAVALQEVIKQNRAATEVDTGDEVADEAFAHGVQTVLCDLEQMLNDLGQGFDVYRSERPYIPLGFKIHAVVTH